MLPEEQKTNDPKKLLQEQVELMREIRTSLISMQETLNRLQHNVSNLTKLNADVANKGLDVFVENIDMPFLAMIGFIVKKTIASIPAAIVVIILILLVTKVITMLFGGSHGVFSIFSPLIR